MAAITLQSQADGVEESAPVLRIEGGHQLRPNHEGYLGCARGVEGDDLGREPRKKKETVPVYAWLCARLSMPVWPFASCADDGERWLGGNLWHEDWAGGDVPGFGDGGYAMWKIPAVESAWQGMHKMPTSSTPSKAMGSTAKGREFVSVLWYLDGVEG